MKNLIGFESNIIGLTDLEYKLEFVRDFFSLFLV
jgi:hypothetical protein